MTNSLLTFILLFVQIAVYSRSETVNADKSNISEYRLPTNIVPVHYAIQITPHITTENFTFDGVIEIIAGIRQDTTEVILHTDNILHKNISLKCSDINVKITRVIHDEAHQFLRIITADSLLSGNTLNIKIVYVGFITEEKRGLYRNYYYDNFNEIKWYAATNLIPTGARRLFPCFDEPEMRATFQLNVSRTVNLKTISTVELKTTIRHNDRYIDIFEKTSNISTYRLSFIVSESRSIDEISYFYWIKSPLIDEQLMQWLFQSENMNYFQQYTRIMNQLENWIPNSRYISDSLTSELQIMETYKIVDEAFLNRISPHWWNNSWLSIGFTEYYMMRIAEKMTDTPIYFYMFRRYVVETLHPLLLTDALPTTHAVSEEVYKPGEISNVFDSVSRVKGAHIHRMIFRLTNYLNYDCDNKVFNYLKNNHQNLNIDNYSSLFDNNVQVNYFSKFNTSFTTVVNSWINQAGYPVLHVNITKNNVTFFQEQFLLNPSDRRESRKTTWWIPITWTSNADYRSVNGNFHDINLKFWLNKTSDTIIIDNLNGDDDWIIFNVQQTGYYRVNYDRNSWRRIIEYLESSDYINIHEINRASLIDDLFNLARAGYVDYTIALSATQYLIQEIFYCPWKAALNNFEFLHKRITDNNIRNLFNDHVLTIIEPIYEYLKANEDKKYANDLLLFSNIVEWACKLGHYDCVDYSLTTFNNRKDGWLELIPVNYRQTIYCTVIKYGSDESWLLLKKQYDNENVQHEKNILINGLACTPINERLRQLLEISVSKNITMRLEDRLFIISTVYTSGIMGTKEVLNFLQLHYDDVHSYCENINQMKNFFSIISSDLITKELVDKWKYFTEIYSDKLAPIQNFLTLRVLEAYENLKWNDLHSSHIEEFLSRLYFNKDYLLPKSNVHPVIYNISLESDLLNDFSFNGTAVLTLNITKDISSIVLYARGLIISDIKAAWSTQQQIDVINYRFDIHHRLFIYFGQTISGGSRITLSIKYTGRLYSETSELVDNNFTNGWKRQQKINVLQFKLSAMQVFPCFNERIFSGKIYVNIYRPTFHYKFVDIKLLAPSIFFTDSDENWTGYEVDSTSTSHLAFAVAIFYLDDNSIHNTSSYLSAIEHLHDFIKLGQKALNYLEEFTGIFHQMGKMTLDFPLDERNTPMCMKQNHRIAFVNMLVDNWLSETLTVSSYSDYVWLNEGLAEYFSWVIMNDLEPESKILKQFIVYAFQKSLLSNSFVDNVINLRNKTEVSLCESNTGHSAVISGKASGIIHMITSQYGGDILQEAAKKYFQAYQGKTVKLSYLWAAIDEKVKENIVNTKSTSNLEITTLMNSWTNQPGYPVVYASLINNSLTLKQERFLITSEKISCQNLYDIPITLATKSVPCFSNASPRLWLSDPESTHFMPNTKDEWFIVNTQQTGFYRVNYDFKNWQKLIDALNRENFDYIPELNRAQIIDDLFNLARANYIPYNLTLNATMYLINERNHLPWIAFFNGISYLYDVFTSQHTEVDLKQYISTLIKPIFDEIGFEENITDSQMEILTRNLIVSWACKVDYIDCVINSKNIFYQWKENTNKYISPDVKKIVLCTAIKNGDNDDWEFLLTKYLNATTESDEILLLNCLACSESIVTIHEYLDYIIFARNATDHHIRTAFSSVYNSKKYGTYFVLDYLEKNYDKIYEYINNPDVFMMSILDDLLSNISTKTQITKLLPLLSCTNNREGCKNISKKFKKSILYIDQNLKWYDSHGYDIQLWLSTNSIISTTSVYSKRHENIKNPRKVASIIIYTSLLLLLLFIIFYCCCYKNRQMCTKVSSNQPISVKFMAK